MKSYLFFLFSLLLVLSASQLSAQDVKVNNKPVRFLVAGALELGGDEVAEVIFIDGNTQSVNAGQGGSLFVGGQFQLPSVDKVYFRTAVGFKYVTTAADNVDIRMTRIPIHLTAHYLITDDVHIGGGLALHRNIKFKTDGLSQDVGFTGGTGPRVEAGWKGLALTYTALTYTGDSGEEYNASNFGLSFTAVFPK